MALGLFVILFQAVFPYIFPLQPQNVLDEALHALCVGPFHLVGYMSINVQGKGCGRVAQVPLDCFYIIPSPDGCDGVAVPLRYNYDKPEKPRRIKGFEVFSLIFSSFSKPKNHTEISRIAGGVSLTTNE